MQTLFHARTVFNQSPVPRNYFSHGQCPPRTGCLLPNCTQTPILARSHGLIADIKEGSLVLGFVSPTFFFAFVRQSPLC